MAEAKLAQLEYNNTKKLFEAKERSSLRMRCHCSRPNWRRAKAKADLAQAELDFTNVKAPFDGIVDRLHEQLAA